APETTVPTAVAHAPDLELSRRRFILGAFWTGLGVSLAGSVGVFLDFFWPRGIEKFGGPFALGNVADFEPGDNPQLFIAAQTWIVNLDPAETRAGGSGGGEGYLALWRKCPHLGCSVPWRPTFQLREGEDEGWFRCPCHGSTYTKAGVRVFGPAPRSMDVFELSVDDEGNLTVHTDRVLSGSPENFARARTLDQLREASGDA
ncbi:MAG: Rieske 2Fe-2S domain-containing protein, partial [Chloroflexi bacterium]|nr:Rieske 2Fe-2S domain-containing protein [Chloroflexota bacterium]